MTIAGCECGCGRFFVGAGSDREKSAESGNPRNSILEPHS